MTTDLSALSPEQYNFVSRQHPKLAPLYNESTRRVDTVISSRHEDKNEHNLKLHDLYSDEEEADVKPIVHS